MNRSSSSDFRSRRAWQCPPQQSPRPLLQHPPAPPSLHRRRRLAPRLCESPPWTYLARPSAPMPFRSSARNSARTDAIAAALSKSRPALGLGAPPPHLLWNWAHPGHICTGAGCTLPAFALGLGAPPPHLCRDWAHPRHICARTGLIPTATSAPRLGAPRPHLHRDSPSTGIRTRAASSRITATFGSHRRKSSL